MNNQTESTIGSADLTPLDGVKDVTAFLAALQTLYRTHGIGEGLPFSEIEAYWRDESALSEAWLDELGRSVRCERPQGFFGLSGPRGNAIRTHRVLLDGLDSSQWFRVADKCLYLMSPLLVPEDLVYWGTFTYLSSPQETNTGFWRAGLVSGLLTLAESLEKGDQGWQALHAWMAEAGSDPGLLHSLLTKFSDDVWRESDDYCAVLTAHHTLLVLMRLLLRAQGPDWEGWHKCVMPITLLLSNRHVTPVDLADHQALQRNHAAPIFKAARSAPDFVERLVQQVDQNRITGLMTELGMSFLLAEQPERFQALLDKLDKGVLRAFYPSDELAEAAPDLLFYHVRRRYERTHQLAFPDFKTPEAVNWYQKQLPRIEQDHDRRKCIDWLVKRLPQADTVLMLNQYCDRNTRLPHHVLDTIDDIDGLQRFLACSNDTLSGRAAQRLRELALPERVDRRENEYRYEPDPQLWPVLIEQSKRYPDLFIWQTLDAYYLNPQELERWALLWQSTTNADCRQQFAAALFHACRKIERVKGVDTLAFAEGLYREDPTPFQTAVDELYEDDLGSYIDAISDRENPLWVLIPKMAARYLMQSTWLSDPIDALNPVPVQRAMASYPEGFAALEEKAKVKLLPFFNDPAVIACRTALTELLAKANKALYRPGVQLIARSGLDALRESGLLELSGKKARKLLLTGLALNKAEDITPILHQLIDDKAHDDFSRGLMLDNLQARGESVAGLDDWSDLTVERVQALAAEEKIPAAVSKLWNADLAERLSELGEPGGLYLLSLIHSGDGERLPRKARQVLELIPAGRRGDFALLGVNQWIAEDGSDKFNVLLPPLFEYGDERVANDLVKACKAWKKKRKTKSSAAIQLLCRLPGNYGVAQAHALWESQQFSESIMNNAKLALTEAAERAGMSFQDFIEQLVPDFGLEREGLVLDVGPYSYQVKIKPDLSLMVIGPNGKTTKSFPKAKADEDPDKRSLAENQFKGLRKNLKPVLKQQSKRLMRGFSAGKRWNLALWQRLFLDHPLMNIIATGIVWGAEDGDGEPLVRFRPSDTGELLDLEDENVALDGAKFIHMVHPVEVDGEERAAWQAHFKDYAVASPIGQWEAPVYEASPEELEADRVTRQRTAVINRGAFGGLMDKWGYLKGPAEDGAMINGHTWLVSHGEWLVECEHSGVSVFFDAYEAVTVDALVPHRYAPGETYSDWKPVALKELPIALRATLLAQAEALKAADMD